MIDKHNPTGPLYITAKAGQLIIKYEKHIRVEENIKFD